MFSRVPTVSITADDEELVHRLLARAKATGRSDYNEAVIRHREVMSQQAKRRE
jgi:hypothetical protein